MGWLENFASVHGNGTLAVVRIVIPAVTRVYDDIIGLIQAGGLTTVTLADVFATTQSSPATVPGATPRMQADPALAVGGEAKPGASTQIVGGTPLVSVGPDRWHVQPARAVAARGGADGQRFYRLAKRKPSHVRG